MQRKSDGSSLHRVLSISALVLVILTLVCLGSLGVQRAQRVQRAIGYEIQYWANYGATYAPGTKGGIELPAVCSTKDIHPGATITNTDVKVRLVEIMPYTKKDSFYFVEEVVGGVATRRIEKASVITRDAILTAP